MSMGTSWSLILAAIAAFISNTCALLLLIIACKQNQETSGIIHPNAEDEIGTVSNIPMQQMQMPNDRNHVYPTAPPPYIQAPMIMHTYGYNMYHSLAHPSGHFGPVYPQYTHNYQISPPPQYTEKQN
ncbi:hypothetical protein ACJMK2_034313 [Sinanodonta woodiana]|uniref:Amelogenin n=1 Tax=Sinanodonta woodiana TaxID=1069815 RepID=A0ABD3WR60_SINWO